MPFELISKHAVVISALRLPHLTAPFHLCVHSDLEQLRKIRRRSPHDDTEAFTVFLRSDVEAKLVLLFTLYVLKDLKKLK